MSGPSSSSEARTEPPSDSRIDEARAQGHVPRAELVGVAAIWLVLVGALSLFSRHLTDFVQSTLREPLLAIVSGDRPAIAAWPLRLLGRVGATWASVLVLCAFCALLARAVAQGFTFRVGRPARAKRFAPMARTRWISAGLSALCIGAMLGIAAPTLLRTETPSLLPTLSVLAFRLAGVLALVALLDALLVRTAWWRSLWMTRHERRTEEREAYGTPELRAARERLRRESHAESPLGSRP